MRDAEEYLMRLTNWGYWSRVDRGEPATFPASEPFLKWAKTSEFTDEGWAQFDKDGKPIEPSAPEPPRLIIHEKDAQRVNEIISGMSNLHKYLLRDKYVRCDPQVFRFVRYEDEQAFTEQAELAFAKLIQPLPSGKHLVLEMISQKWKTKDITRFARVSRQYVWKLRSMSR